MAGETANSNKESFGAGFKRVISQKMSVGGGEPTFNIENLIATAVYGVAGFFGGRLIAKKTGKGRLLTVNKDKAKKALSDGSEVAEKQDM
jgi:hypothetical protein